MVMVFSNGAYTAHTATYKYCHNTAVYCIVIGVVCVRVVVISVLISQSQFAPSHPELYEHTVPVEPYMGTER
jgi:hypothetical protein